MRTAILKSDGLFVKAIGGWIRPGIVNFGEILTKRCIPRGAAEAEIMRYPEVEVYRLVFRCLTRKDFTIYS